MDIFKSHRHTSFTIIVKKNTLPLAIAKLIAISNGYTLEIVGESSELIKYRFTKIDKG